MGLTLNTFQNLSDFYRLRFAQNLNLEGKELIVVVPNPKIADHLRLRFKEAGVIASVKVESISTFLRKKLKEESCDRTVLRKSDILLHLTTVWNRFFKDGSYALFSQAYEIFSDWRSFSLDLNIFEEALQSLDPTIQKAVVFFWKYLETADFYDEHGAYDFLAKKELSTDTIDYIFYGFAHLSGTQISMLKNLGHYKNIYLPMPDELLNNSQYSDWPNWIETRKIGSTLSREMTTLDLWSVGYDGQSLNQLVPDFQGEVLLLGDQTKFNYAQELQGGDYFAKTTYSISEDRFSVLVDVIRDFIQKNTKLIDLISSLELLKEEKIKNHEWIDLKVIGLFLENLNYIKETVEYITAFVAEVIIESTRLNLPRTYLITLEASEDNVILGADYLWAPREKGHLNLIVKDSDTIFASGSTNYSAPIYKVLANIGPIQRGGFRRDWLQFNLKDQLQNRPINVYISHEVLEINQWWKEVFSRGKIKNINLNSIKKLPEWKIPEDTSAIKRTYSASEIQTYNDCPRKYYVQYIEKLDPRIINEKDLSASDIGSIEHDFIKHYYENEKEYSFSRVQDLAFDFIEYSIKKLNRQIDFLKKEIVTEELINYTSEALELIYEIKKAHDVNFVFESEFVNTESRLHGRIDCYFKNSELEGVFDFKRSKVPSFKEVLNFKNWQLWVYALGIKKSKLNKTFGYLNLSEKNKSWMMTDHTLSCSEEIKQNIVNFEELKVTAANEVSKIIAAIDLDKKFLINPRNASVCAFCPANFFCPRMEANP